MVLIGYSGHAYVVADIFQLNGTKPTHYCDVNVKPFNPYQLIYLGKETAEASINKIKKEGFFIAIGDNNIRQKIQQYFSFQQVQPLNAVHPSAIIAATTSIANSGVMIAAGVIINPLSVIGNGVICNSGSIIEHDCVINEFAHIAPGAVLCGNVKVGRNSFIGAGAVVRPGITIGSNVIVGAGAVVVKDVYDNNKVMGNPARLF